MATSIYMPSIVVEIAFNAGYNTPAASRTWTDVSDYVELHENIGIDFGRQDERSTAGANILNLTLDNTDGRFTAGRAGSPYYPNVKLGRPIRVRATPPGGTTSTRFVGFVDEWPVEWDGTDAYAKAKIKASSRLARLGLSTKLRSMPEEAILAGSPAAYWTLGDPAGSTSAVDSSGRGAPSLVAVADGYVGDTGAPIVFGNATGPGTDGLTAAEFSSGQVLRATLAGPVRALHVTLRVDATPASSVNVMAYSTLYLRLQSSGTLRADLAIGGGGAIVSTDTVNDGATHDVTLTYAPSGTCYMYIDGVLQGSGTGGSFEPEGGLSIGAGFTGTLSHLAFYDASSLTPDAVAIAGAVLGVAQRTDIRLLQMAAWAGVASTEVTTQTGVETMTYQQTSGQTVVDALRDVESTEGGVLFDGRDGNVTFHNRSNRYLQTVAATLDMAAQHVGADYAPKLDRSTLVNDAEVSNPTTGEKARATDTASSDEYGVASTTGTSVADTYDALQQKAAWMVTSYAEPRPRVPSLTVDVLAMQGEVNWITNPSFEVNTSGWGGNNGTLARQATTSPPAGSFALEYTSTASVAAGNVIFSNPVTAAPGEVFNGSVFVRMGSQSSDYRIYLRWYNSGGGTISDTIAVTPAGSLSSSVFTRISVQGTAPAGTAQVRILVLPSSGLTIGNTFRIDGAQITKTDTLLDYFDGSSAGSEWSGTAHASTSFSSSPSAQTLLGLTVSDLLAVTNAPAQADTTNPSYFVEGGTETIGPESYEISFNLSPTYPALNTFVLDDPVRGVLDSTYVLAL
jgi:hypothetical protein